MKLFVAGEKTLGADALDLVVQLGHDVLGVSSPAFDGRDSRLPFFAEDGTQPWDRLRANAARLGLPWIPVSTLNEDNLPAGVDLVLSTHGQGFIGHRTRLRCRVGVLGYHPSLLPLHRGQDAVRWALTMGERVTGGSVFWLSETMDGGDLAAQDWCFVRPDDTSESLWHRELHPLGLRLMRKVFLDLEDGIVVAVPQDHSLATWEPAWQRCPRVGLGPSTEGPGFPSGFAVIREKEALGARVQASG
jgi:methionyl-tRNA formyltransferase